MSDKKLKVIVAGLGRIAWQYHLPEIVKHPNFELLAVADPLAERLEEARTAFKVPHTYETFDAMLANEPKANLLVLTSPTCFHPRQAITAMERGLDVFCEKPLANSLEDAEEMVAAMERLGRKLMVYQPHRVRPETLALLDVLNSGLLGEVFMVRRVCSRYSRRNDWQSLLEFGGGMLNNYGAHFIDQFMYLFGQAPYRPASCELRRVVSSGDADDVAKITLVSGNGVIGEIDINMASVINDNSWTVWGSRGAAVLKSDAWQVTYIRPEDIPALPLQGTLAAQGRQYAAEAPLPRQEQLFSLPGKNDGVFYDYLYDYLALRRPPFVPVEHTLELMRINAACRELAERNHPLNPQH